MPQELVYVRGTTLSLVTAQLGLAEKTARNRRSSMYAKLGVEGRAVARRWVRAGTAVPAVHTELQALLADPDVQAVYIATPHDSHARLAAECLRAGQPVLCGKPLTPTPAQTQDLVALLQGIRMLSFGASGADIPNNSPLTDRALASCTTSGRRPHRNFLKHSPPWAA